jgi:hypothetical protein
MAASFEKRACAAVKIDLFQVNKKSFWVSLCIATWNMQAGIVLQRRLLVFRVYPAGVTWGDIG